MQTLHNIPAAQPRPRGQGSLEVRQGRAAVWKDGQVWAQGSSAAGQGKGLRRQGSLATAQAAQAVMQGSLAAA